MTLAPDDGGLVCQVVSATLTVCRRLPPLLTWGQAVLWVVAGAVFLTLWGTAFLYLDELKRIRRRGRVSSSPLPLPEAVVPFIHFPSRAQDIDHEP